MPTAITVRETLSMAIEYLLVARINGSGAPPGWSFIVILIWILRTLALSQCQTWELRQSDVCGRKKFKFVAEALRVIRNFRGCLKWRLESLRTPIGEIGCPHHSQKNSAKITLFPWMSKHFWNITRYIRILIRCFWADTESYQWLTGAYQFCCPPFLSLLARNNKHGVIAVLLLGALIVAVGDIMPYVYPCSVMWLARFFTNHMALYSHLPRVF